MERKGRLYLGATEDLSGAGGSKPLFMPPHHLVTHSVLVGMTGSGKTGLLMVTMEEALLARVPVLMIDVKGDLPNLLLAFPTFDAEPFLPWAASRAKATDERPVDQIAAELAEQRRTGLEAWGIDVPALQHFNDTVRVRVITPGATSGEPLHVLSALERHNQRWDTDVEGARATLSAALSLLLRLLGRDPDPARSRDHVLLSVLAERRLRAGGSADLPSLLDDLKAPPIEQVGGLELSAFVSKKERAELAAALNTLLASPTFASWREGVSLDIQSWFSSPDGRTPAIIVSVAHLDDDERALVLGVLLEEVLTWVRSLPGSNRLRALIAFDEVYGFIPPHPASPPTKPPLVALLKQARAFGVGVVLATQNPMDLDYRALSNAGLWCIGRLQTDADRARIIDGLALNANETTTGTKLPLSLQRLLPRWFVVRDVHAGDGIRLLQPRWAMSYLCGPMTRSELRRARGV